MVSLKSFIKSVRASKTIADERSVIRKESAAIRTSFRDVSLDHGARRVSIAKLLYLHILGEKTHFGQVECIKLLASPSFCDKRLGYLAVMLLLDENQEVLTLLTNLLDLDMAHANPAVVGLALCTLGNVASAELLRDLHQQVDRILASGSAYLRKKAAVVAAKLVEKDADLCEVFLPRVALLLNDKAHGVVLGGVALARALYAADPTTRALLRQTTPLLLRRLTQLQTQGYLMEHDVGGVADPFLQVALLGALREMSCGEYAEAVNEVLTQVALGAEGGKNAAHAVLYEAVRTIFHTRADAALKVLGVNILGRFLGARDNNTRYVALNTLLAVLAAEPQAVQRHRAVVVQCLGDSDVLIRRRALELTFALVNAQNVRVLIGEVLRFLETADDALKPYVVTQVYVTTNKYAPNRKWHFDALTRMLALAGNFVSADIVSGVLALVMDNTDAALTRHVVGALYRAAAADPSQVALRLVAVWCLGEYGDAADASEDDRVAFLAHSVHHTAYDAPHSLQVTAYVLTAALKLSVRLTQPASLERLRRLLEGATRSIDLALQIRAVEYLEIFHQPVALRRGLLARMPAPVVRERAALSLSGNTSAPDPAPAQPAKPAEPSAALLLDIFGDVPPGSIPPGSIPTGEAPHPSNKDILSLFTTQPDPAGSPLSNQDHPAGAPAPPPPGVCAHASAPLAVHFVTHQLGNGTAKIDTLVHNRLSRTLTNLTLLIAVPKSQRLQLGPIATSIAPGQTATQTMQVTGTKGGKLKLRVKVGYTLAGAPVQEQFDFGGFAATL